MSLFVVDSKDGNGYLDMHEAKKFLTEVLRESGIYSTQQYGNSHVSEERHVREAFLEIDTDNSRSISKDEMKEQLGRIIGI